MLRIKRLYTFVVGTFLPLLLATYSVCLFILLMQFLWKYVNDMVGKGVGMDVLGELFLYASVSFTPQALPLAVLLASLMTFGNLGEHLELLAMKASGISLLRIMKPLIYFVVGIACISFVFQNELVPRAQTKTYTIMLSLKQKSPELDIPEGSFFKDIPGYNLYVRHKDKKGGMLRDLMIYDYSGGFENMTVIVADSGKLNVSADKKYLVLTLYSGELFKNLRNRQTRNPNEKIPYQRETFRLRDILISFDTSFKMEDESIMGSRDSGKNINELTSFIDSVRLEQDSMNLKSVDYFKNSVYDQVLRERGAGHSIKTDSQPDSLFVDGFEAYYNQLTPEKKLSCLQQAKNKAEQFQMDYNLTVMRQSDSQKQLLAHIAQFYKRFSLALSCLLFFFVGASLGAIIRKGGLGLPAVISVLLYLSYYTIDTFGTKMAKQDVWPVWEGVWLSTAFLAALGVFFTYKALNDSTMLNVDDWKIAFQKFMEKIKKKNQKNG